MSTRVIRIWDLPTRIFHWLLVLAVTGAIITGELRGDLFVWHGAGHNPLGALSVFAMLGVLLCQAGTGLFSSANRDHFQGPLYDLVGKTLSHTISNVHEFIFNFTIVFLVLHISAIAYYVRIKKKNLVPAMLTGNTEVDNDSVQPAQGGGPLALIVALALAIGVVWLIGSGTLVRLLA